MHYDSKEVLFNNIIKIVVYKHDTLEGDKPYYDVTSIQGIKYVRFYKIAELYYSFKVLFKEELDKLEFERFYLLDFRINKDDEFELLEVKDVTDSKNPFMTLH